jgi:hypothetical protein
MSAKRNSSGAQLSLGIQHDEQSTSVVCRGIFSLNYLKQHFAKAGDFPSLDEARPIYEKVKNRWLEEYAGLRTRKAEKLYGVEALGPFDEF